MLDLRLMLLLTAAACRAPAPVASAPSPPPARPPAPDAAIAIASTLPADAAVVAPLAPVPLDAAVASSPPGGGQTQGIEVRTDRTMGDINADCRKVLPRCAHVYADIQWPPDPCATRGAACNEPPRSTRGEKVWAVCRCEACSTDRDCPHGSYCAQYSGLCPPQRIAGTCKAGTPRPEDGGTCPAPP